MFINPFTLLIIPLLGSLLILIYPSEKTSFSKLGIKSFSTVSDNYNFSSSSVPAQDKDIATNNKNVNQNSY
jgi:hypothetical protein